MGTTIKTDAVIIGAGPSGLSLACQFVRHGVDFVVIEKNENVTPYSKAIGVHARTLEIPDNYIGFISTEKDASGLGDYLNDFIRYSRNM